MGGKKFIYIAIHATIFTIFLVAPIVFSDDNTPIPADASQVNNWFNANVKHYTARKGTLNTTLVAAEDVPRYIKVSKDGSGNFKTITDAINSIPSGNTRRVIVFIGGGIYNEKIRIDRSKPFVTLYGSPNGRPTLTYGGTAKQYGTVDSATLIAESDFFMAVNLVIVNSAPKPSGKQLEQGVALRISGDKAAIYNCKIIGFQDTVCDDRGHHFFKDCYIEGTVDFIFGSGTSIYLNTELHVLGDDQFTFITAHARDTSSEQNGYSLVHCKITGTGTGTFLGRAWRTHSRVVYAYTTMSGVIRPVGWSDNFHPERDGTVSFGEYQCSGPGSSLTGRVKFTKQLSGAQVQPFLTLGFIEASKWLLPPPYL